MLHLNDKILITGGRGLVGSALTSYLLSLGYENVVSLGKDDCDLLNKENTEALFVKLKPDYVFHIAARVYGIMGNMRNQGLAFYENCLMNLNVIEACRKVEVKKIVAMGTSAAYPYPASYPLKEEDFWMGEPHHSEYGYAQAKRAMLAQLSTYHQSYGLNYCYIMGTNLYGPNDKFDTINGHVVPSLIKKFYDAKQDGSQIVVWGDGTAKRDFLHAHDAAKAMLLFLKSVQGPVNLASGVVHSIKDVVDCLATHLDMRSQVVWDTSKPNGLPFRSFDLTKQLDANFKPEISLFDGLIQTFEWYAAHQYQARKI